MQQKLTDIGGKRMALVMAVQGKGTRTFVTAPGHRDVQWQFLKQGSASHIELDGGQRVNRICTLGPH